MDILEVKVDQQSFARLCRSPFFVLIFPYEHPTAQKTNINCVARLVAVSDEDLFGMLFGEDGVSEEIRERVSEENESTMASIEYIRDCPLSGVTRVEWQSSHGPANPAEFMKVVGNHNPQQFVRIVALKKMDYSLRELNQTFGKNHGR